MFDVNRLLLIAKEQSRSSRWLCEIAGKSPAFIADLKKGKGKVSPALVNVWAEALHTTPEYLTGETDEPAQQKSPTLAGGAYTDIEILDAFNRADQQTQEAIRLLLRLK